MASTIQTPDFIVFHNESFILRLPDELLLYALHFLVPETPFRLRTDYGPYLSVLSTCRRFRRLYEPILYRALSLGSQGWEMPLRPKKLVRTLGQRPDLREYVWEIDVMLDHYAKPLEDTVSVIAEIIENCSSNLLVVCLQGRWCSELLPVVQAIARCSHLERLILGAKMTGPSIEMVIEIFKLPKIQKLDLQRCSFIPDDATLEWGDIDKQEERDVARLGRHLRPKSGAISTLNIREPLAWPNAIEALVIWPKNLASFTLESQSSSGTASNGSWYIPSYTCNAVQKIIKCQNESLRYVNLGVQERSGIPDFRQFPFLEELHLSAFDLMPSATNTMDFVVRNLDAPNLGKLVICYAPYLDWSTATDTLQEEKVICLETLAIRVPQLKTIFLKLNPTFERHVVIQGREWWPWKYIEVAVRRLEECGVDLAYKKPAIPMSEWEKMTKHERKRRKRRATGHVQYRNRKVAMEAREAAKNANQDIDDLGDFFEI